MRLPIYRIRTDLELRNDRVHIPVRRWRLRSDHLSILSRMCIHREQYSFHRADTVDHTRERNNHQKSNLEDRHTCCVPHTYHRCNILEAQNLNTLRPHPQTIFQLHVL